MPETRYHVPLHTRLGRAVSRPLFRGLFHVLSHVQIEGCKNIPPRGAYLIAINHISLFEPPLVLAFWPCAPEAAGAAELWSRPVISILARFYGGIPVHRQEYDRALLDTLVSVLRSGYPLLIAPEGGRSHKPGLRRAHAGVAYLVDAARVPVVPVGVTGSTDDFLDRGLRGQRPTIGMRIGAPLHLPPVEGRGAARRVSRQRNADQIMHQIAALLPLEYRGVYAQEEPGHGRAQLDPA
jgi:1-acyl-sn-glycerol-3-phosphate acyltransferase